mgnify:CR=1 FL=1
MKMTELLDLDRSWPAMTLIDTSMALRDRTEGE